MSETSFSASSPALSATTPSVGPLLSWMGDRHWLLVKEGVHIILDRILVKVRGRGL
jgi:hypothetical protein